MQSVPVPLTAFFFQIFSLFLCVPQSSLVRRLQFFGLPKIFGLDSATIAINLLPLIQQFRAPFVKTLCMLL